MSYKISDYNLIITYSDTEYLLFNTYSTSLLKIQKEAYREIKSSIQKERFELENLEAISKLFDLGIIVSSDFNEKANIKALNRQWKHDPKTYSVAILPNIDCNFRCKYCFEDIEEKYMSEKTIQNIEYYFNNRINSEQIDHLDVSWYGGEPLLSMDIIERLSLTFSKVKNFRACLFTNGFNFNDDFIRNLPKFGIDIVHITIDGIKEVHNKYRLHKNGIETFDKILENIKKIISYNNDSVYINIRTNLDNDNKSCYNDLLGQFQKINSNKFRFQFSKIHEVSTGMGKNYCGELNEEDAEVVYKNVRNDLIKNKFKQPEDFLPKTQHCHHCYVGLDNGFTISYDGSIYKCFGDANPSKNSIGTLNNEGNIDLIKSEYLRWFNHDYFENNLCKNCILLPVCMGGCSHVSLGLTPGVPAKCIKVNVLKRVKENIKEVYNFKNNQI